MRHGSLFSGIGGFDLAAEWMGWSNIFHCEWNEFSSKVLKYYWPDATSYTDITKTDFTVHRGKIDILTGGFPCQPFSDAGKRKGTDDNRYLWPEMYRAIREIQPGYVVAENVPGLVNWNKGMVFDRVQTDLENEGYQVTSYLLPACGKNAPHRRERIWFIAKSENSNAFGAVNSCDQRPQGCEKIREGIWNQPGGNGSERATPNTNGSQRCERRLHTSESETTKRHTGTRDSCSNERGAWDNFPTQSPVRSGNDGLSAQLDGITFSQWRKQSIMVAGNAIVPQIALEIFKAIEQTEIQLSPI